MNKKIINFTRGVPPAESFPTAQLVTCSNEALQEFSDIALQYGNAFGFIPLRECISKEIGVSFNRIIIGQGSLQLLDHLVRSRNADNFQVCVEEPTYDRSITIFKRTSALVYGYPVMKDGIDTERLETDLKKGFKPSLLYVIPDFQNPSGTVMSLEKRSHLINLGLKFGFLIVEDSPYRKLRYWGNELPSLFELAPDFIIQMSSYSKLICPGLRIGYMVLSEDEAKIIGKVAEDTYINTSYFNQAIVYKYIQHRWLEENLAKFKELYSSRLKAMLGALDECMSNHASWTKPEGGFFVGLLLNKKVDLNDFHQFTNESKLSLSDGKGFFIHGGGSFIRLPFCALNPDEINVGIHRLANLVSKIM